MSDLSYSVLLGIGMSIIQALTAMYTDSSVMMTSTVAAVSLRTTVLTDVVFLRTNVTSAQPT